MCNFNNKEAVVFTENILALLLKEVPSLWTYMNERKVFSSFLPYSSKQWMKNFFKACLPTSKFAFLLPQFILPDCYFKFGIFRSPLFCSYHELGFLVPFLMHTNLYICQTNLACDCSMYNPDSTIFLLQVNGKWR